MDTLIKREYINKCQFMAKKPIYYGKIKECSFFMGRNIWSTRKIIEDIPRLTIQELKKWGFLNKGENSGILALYRNGEKAIEFTRKILSDILAGKYSKDKFVITQTIRGPGLTKEEREIDKLLPDNEKPYTDRNTQCHVALADKLADRDSGNKPQSNERIPFIYIETKKKVSLQGDMVEHPDYLEKYNLKK